MDMKYAPSWFHNEPPVVRDVWNTPSVTAIWSMVTRFPLGAKTWRITSLLVESLVPLMSIFVELGELRDIENPLDTVAGSTGAGVLCAKAGTKVIDPIKVNSKSAESILSFMRFVWLNSI